MTATEAAQRTDEYGSEAELYDLLWAGLNTVDLPFYVSLAEEYGGPVLELACGTGRVLLPCLKAAGEVVGVDLSPSMLERARARIAAEGVDEQAIQLVEGDIRTVRLGRKFPYIFLGGTPLYHLPTNDEWLQALATIREHLAPGGHWAGGLPVPEFDAMTKYQGRQYFVAEVRHPETGQRVAMWDYNTYDLAERSVTRRRVTETLDESGLVLERRHATRKNFFRAPDEIKDLIHRAGFRIEQTFGGYQRQPFAPGSDYLVWIATVDD